MQQFDQDAFNRFVVDNGVYGFFEEEVTLKSGRKSHFYANFRTIVEDVWLTEQLVGHVLAFVAGQNIVVDTFYGVPEGATKLGVLIQFHWAKLQSNYGQGSHVLAMGRGKPKEHGAIKDRFHLGIPQGRTLMLEDVTTTAGSALTMLDNLQETGVEVVGMISLTDRRAMRDDGRSVQQAVGDKGVQYYSMSTAHELLPLACKKYAPGEKIARAIEEEYKQYGVEPLSLP